MRCCGVLTSAQDEPSYVHSEQSLQVVPLVRNFSPNNVTTAREERNCQGITSNAWTPFPPIDGQIDDRTRLQKVRSSLPLALTRSLPFPSSIFSASVSPSLCLTENHFQYGSSVRRIERYLGSRSPVRSVGTKKGKWSIKVSRKSTTAGSHM